MEQRFWPRLETPFAELLVALPEDRSVVPDSEDEDDIEFGTVSLPRWIAAVRATARQAFMSTTAGLGQSGRQLKAVAVARSTFERELAKELAPWAERYARKGEAA